MEDFRRSQYRKDLEVIAKYISSGRVLDVGCGPGFFLDEARKLGYEVMGLEPATTAAMYARERLGLEVLNVEFERADLPKEAFDVVTMFAVLEHIARPRSALSGVIELLRPGGLLVIKVPRNDSLVARLIYGSYRLSLGRMASPLRSLFDWDYQYPHLYHFSTSSLERLHKDLGQELLEHRAEGSINVAAFDQRLSLTDGDKGKDLSWATGGFMRFAIRSFVGLSAWLGYQDDVIVYSRRPAS